MSLIAPANEQTKAMDLKSFGIGLAVVGGIYILIFAYVFLSAQRTITELEARLPSISVPISNVSEETSHTEEIKDSQKPKNADILTQGLLEKSENGFLPIVRKEDGLTSFRAYQLPFDFKKADKPVVIFIVKDFGLSAETSQSALDLLPPEVGFILSPYSAMPDEWIRLAKESKHEVWINTPIENKSLSQNDSGLATIMTKSSYVQKLSALHWALSRGSGYIGIASDTDEAILGNKEQFSNLIDEVYDRGLGYLELNPSANSFIQSKALAKDAPYVKADMEILRLDGEHSFKQLEDKLNENGVIVAVVPNFPNQIKDLAAWILKIGQSNYTLAPASALYDLALHQSQGKTAAPPAATPPQEVQHAPTPTENLHADDLVSPPPASDAAHH